MNATRPAKQQPWTASPSQAGNSTPHSSSPLQRVHKYTASSTQPVKPCSAHKAAPYASRVFTTIPYTTEVTSYPDHIFRILILRRLRLPLPLTERACRCRRAVDPLGDHLAACSRAGVLRSRGVPLGHAAARVCREVGAVLQCKPAWPTSTSLLFNALTAVPSKSSQLGCHCCMAPSWPSTPRWSHL